MNQRFAGNKEAGKLIDVEEKLSSLLGMVNDWLKYSEAKNGGLVAFSGVGLSAIATYLATASNPSAIVMLGFGLSGILLAFSLIVGLISFLPQEDADRILQGERKEPAETDNLYFYGDLQKYTPEALVEQIAYRYVGLENVDAKSCRSCIDLAGQIIVNSRIAARKFQCFRMAARGMLLAAGIATAMLMGLTIHGIAC